MSQPTLSADEKKLFDTQVSKNIQMSQPTLSADEKKLFDTQVSKNIQMSQPTLSSNKNNQLTPQENYRNVQMSLPIQKEQLMNPVSYKNVQMSPFIPKKQLTQPQDIRNIQMSASIPKKNLRQPSNDRNVQMFPQIPKKEVVPPYNYKNVQMSPPILKKQLMLPPNYTNVQVHPPIQTKNQPMNYLNNADDDDIINIHSNEIENFSKNLNANRDFYLEIRDKKIIKIINDSEIFSKYCRNNKVSKRDIIAAINANYYRVIENINVTNMKVKNNYNYEHLISLFNNNVSMLWSKISFNLLKKFYIYITELIV